MKYISLLIVIVFIGVTFWLSRKTDDLTIDQMNRMNDTITEYMTQALQEKNPDATEIEFSKIYTEVIESGKEMRAHFKFSYMEPNKEDEMERVYRKGSFLITSEDGEQWTARIEEAGDVKVEFMESFGITGSGGKGGVKVEDAKEGSKPSAGASKNSQTNEEEKEDSEFLSGKDSDEDSESDKKAKEDESSQSDKDKDDKKGGPSPEGADESSKPNEGGKTDNQSTNK